MHKHPIYELDLRGMLAASLAKEMVDEWEDNKETQNTNININIKIDHMSEFPYEQKFIRVEPLQQPNGDIFSLHFRYSQKG